MPSFARRIAVIALAATGPAGVHAARIPPDAPFVDMDNDGKAGPGDLPLEPLLADGAFWVQQAKGDYQPPAGPVGIVFPKKFTTERTTLALIATGDITVSGDLTVGSSTQGLLQLVTTG